VNCRGGAGSLADRHHHLAQARDYVARGVEAVDAGLEMGVHDQCAALVARSPEINGKRAARFQTERGIARFKGERAIARSNDQSVTLQAQSLDWFGDYVDAGTYQGEALLRLQLYLSTERQETHIPEARADQKFGFLDPTSSATLFEGISAPSASACSPAGSTPHVL